MHILSVYSLFLCCFDQATDNGLDFTPELRELSSQSRVTMNISYTPISRILLLLLLVATIMPVELQARNNNNKKKVQPASRKGAAAELPTVKSVRGDMIVVGKKIYKVSPTSQIIVNGIEASVSAIKPGMQAAVSGSVLTYGDSNSDTIYKATRISARSDNKLEAKRKADNKKQAEKARKANQRNNKNNKNRNKR